MITELIPNKVYYKVFDKTLQGSTLFCKRPKLADINKELLIKVNHNLILDEYQASDILILNQMHGTDVVDADNITNFQIEPEGDGAITTKKDLVLAIYTADCVSVLISSNDGKIIGVAHCGWRSCKDNILTKLIKMMKEKGALAFSAVIGPAIQQPSYQVDQQYYENFIAESLNYKRFFIPSQQDQHYLFDLPGFVISKLEQEGITNIHYIQEDTYSNANKYPSYRRNCHNGMYSVTEIILSTIVIK